MKLFEVLSFACALLSFGESFTSGHVPPSEEVKDESEKKDESQSLDQAEEVKGQLLYEKTKESQPLGLVEKEPKEPEFELTPVKGITEVPGAGKIPYLEKHPKANTDKLKEEERKTLCRIGFGHVQENVHGIKFKFLENHKTENIKAYVLVDSLSEDTSDMVEVVPAYQCPTEPETYIHISFGDGQYAMGGGLEEDEGGEEEEPLYQVIYKVGRRAPVFKELLVYQTKLVESIVEVDVEKITSVPPSSIEASLYDADAMSETQRRQVCRRAIHAAPEIDIELLDEETEQSGPNKYYSIVTNSHRTSNSPKKFRVIMQTFACPCRPRLYIHVNGHLDRGHYLWAIMEEADVEKLPTHNIMGYEILPVVSIKIHEGPLEDESEDSDEVSRVIINSDSQSLDEILREREMLITANNSDSNMTDIDSETISIDSKMMDIDSQKRESDIEEKLMGIGSTRVTIDSKSRADIDLEVREDAANEPMKYEETRKSRIKASWYRESIMEGEDNTIERAKKDEARRAKSALVRERLRRLNIAESEIPRVSRELRELGIDITRRRNIVKDAKIDADKKLSEEGRRAVCKRAIKAVSGRDAVLTDKKTGKSHFYAIEGENIWSQEPNIVKAYECPSEPVVWIHISGRESVENTIWVIVRGRKDFMYLVEQFNE